MATPLRLTLALALGAAGSVVWGSDQAEPGRHIGLVIDTSSSMDSGDTDAPRYTVQIAKILTDLLGPQDAISVVWIPHSTDCDDGPRPDASLALATGQISQGAQFKARLDAAIHYSGGGTLFTAALRTLAQDFAATPRMQHLMILITDATNFSCGPQTDAELHPRRWAAALCWLAAAAGLLPGPAHQGGGHRCPGGRDPHRSRGGGHRRRRAGPGPRDHPGAGGDHGGQWPATAPRRRWPGRGRRRRRAPEHERAQHGAGSGFYRDARIYVLADYRLSGRPRHAVARLRADRGAVRLTGLAGEPLQACGENGRWVDLPPGEGQARFGTLYCTTARTLFFELRTG